MRGHAANGMVTAHSDSRRDRLPTTEAAVTTPEWPGGRRAAPTPTTATECFAGDEWRIVTSPAFRALADKSQAVFPPRTSERTRLTHTVEVALLSERAANALSLNTALVRAIAMGHDCGHGPGGHAAEQVFSDYLGEPFHHAVWAADVTLRELNLCAETLDGIRNHSWSRPAPATPEGELVSWVDRIAYLSHDLEDALKTQVISTADIPLPILHTGDTLHTGRTDLFVRRLIRASMRAGYIAMDPGTAEILTGFRDFNTERLYYSAQTVAGCALLQSALGAVLDKVESLLAASWDSRSDLRRTTTAVVASLGDTAILELAAESGTSPRYESVLRAAQSLNPEGVGSWNRAAGHRTAR